MISHYHVTGDQPEMNFDQRVADLERRTQQLNAMNAAIMQAVQKAPVIEFAREQGLLPHFAVLATRVRAVEEQFAEMARIVVEDHTLLFELVDLLRRYLQAPGGSDAE